MAIKGSHFVSKQADVAGAFRGGQNIANEALKEENKEEETKPQPKQKSQEQTQTTTGSTAEPTTPPAAGTGLTMSGMGLGVQPNINAGANPKANGGAGLKFAGAKSTAGAGKSGPTRMSALLGSIGSMFTKSKG